MKRAAVALGLCVLLSAGAGQPAQPRLPAGHPVPAGSTWPQAKPSDVASIDAIIGAMYSVPAGEPGQARDWDRYRSLFAPDARLIAARAGDGAAAMATYLTVGDFVASNKKYFEKGGFMDKEIARRVESFGNITHVWSTYESRHKAGDAEPYVRGINSIQLLKDGDRWWIVNLFWDFERPGVTLPDRYLKSPQP